MENDVEVYDGSNTVSGEVRQIGFLEALWGFFSSMKTAIVLLLLLAAASIAGTVIEQGQPDEVYMKAFGPTKYAIYRTLRLTDLYSSSWYKLLLSLIGVNLAVCSINRFGMAWRRSYSPKVAVKPESIARMQRSETFTCPGTVDEVTGRVETALRSGSYCVTKEQDKNGVALYATKGRLSIWGPYITHLSLLVIFAGAIFGRLLGFEGFTNITEGKYTDTYYREYFDKAKGQKLSRKESLGFRVGLKKFTITADKSHNPTGYKSDLQVYDGGKQVASKVIDVNHPLTYKGVTFFQTDYGLVGFVIKVEAPNGEVVYVPYNVQTQSVQGGKAYVINDQPFKEVVIGGKKLTLFVHNLAPDYVGGQQVNASFMPLNPAVDVMVNDRFPEYKGLDAWARLGWLPISKSADYKGFKIALEDVVDYTGLQVSRNPALPVIYLGFGLVLAGVFIAFYMSHRVVRVRISPASNSVTVMVGATSRGEPSIFDKDFDRLRELAAD